MKHRIAFLMGLIDLAAGFIMEIIGVIYLLMIPELHGNHIDAKFIADFITRDQYTTRYPLFMISGAVLIAIGGFTLLFVKVLNDNLAITIATFFLVVGAGVVVVIFVTKAVFSYRDCYILTEERGISSYQIIGDEMDYDIQVTFPSGQTSLLSKEEANKFAAERTWFLYITPKEMNRRWYVINGPHYSGVFISDDYTVDRKLLNTEFK